MYTINQCIPQIIAFYCPKYVCKFQHNLKYLKPGSFIEPCILTLTAMIRQVILWETFWLKMFKITLKTQMWKFHLTWKCPIKITTRNLQTKFQNNQTSGFREKDLTENFKNCPLIQNINGNFTKPNESESDYP